MKKSVAHQKAKLDLFQLSNQWNKDNLHYDFIM